LDQSERVTCRDLQDIIHKHGYQVVNKVEDVKGCIIDFKHPRIEVRPPVNYFLSSVALNKEDGSIETTVRSKIKDYKELYLDYCCEDNTQVCRPHVLMDEKVLSVQAYFRENPKEKFERLLQEMK
jgi:hypothetical protein